MVRLIYRLFLTFNSILLICIVFLIKDNYFFIFFKKYPTWLSQIIYIIIPFLISKIIIKLSKYLSSDSINKKIISIEEASNSYLPSYLGYFFVALSIPNLRTFMFVFIILFIFVYFSQTQYFNPIFLFFRYHFYYVTTDDNSKNIIISKRILKTTDNLEFKDLKRINYYTFIDELEE